MFGKVKNFICLAVLLYAASLSAESALGQDKKPPKDPKEPPARERPPMPGRQPPGIPYKEEKVTMERSSAVDPGVAIKFCVSDGDVKINGWRRNEVRVFVKNGRKFGMKPLEKSLETGMVNWLLVANSPTAPVRAVSECLAGESIEIDAPIGSSFDMSGRAARMSIDSVRKVKVRIAEGVITLRNITGGISANTNEGDLMVDNSAGAIGLQTTTGNIVAIDVKPGQIGELLSAKTNGGAISLQRVEHRQIEAYSISGSVLFDGRFLKGGIYNFRTSAGSIRLAIPAASSCIFKAIYGDGQFESELPLTILTENDHPQVKTVVARLGSGDAMVSLTTRTGSIGIRKAAAGKP